MSSGVGKGTEKQTNLLINCLNDCLIDGLTHRLTGWLTDWQSNRQTDEHTDKTTDRYEDNNLHQNQVCVLFIKKDSTIHSERQRYGSDKIMTKWTEISAERVYITEAKSDSFSSFFSYLSNFTAGDMKYFCSRVYRQREYGGEKLTQMIKAQETTLSDIRCHKVWRYEPGTRWNQGHGRTISTEGLGTWVSQESGGTSNTGTLGNQGYGWTWKTEGRGWARRVEEPGTWVDREYRGTGDMGGPWVRGFRGITRPGTRGTQATGTLCNMCMRRVETQTQQRERERERLQLLPISTVCVFVCLNFCLL